MLGANAWADLRAALDEVGLHNEVDQVVDELIEEVVRRQWVEELVRRIIQRVVARGAVSPSTSGEVVVVESDTSSSSSDSEAEYKYTPIGRRDPRRDTLYVPGGWWEDMSDDEGDAPRGRGGGKSMLWRGHEKASEEMSFEIWRNHVDATMEAALTVALHKNREWTSADEVDKLRKLVEPKYMQAIDKKLQKQGLKKAVASEARQLRGEARETYFAELLDGMWEELVDETAQTALHSAKYEECMRRAGETLPEFHSRLQGYTVVIDRHGEQTRIVEVSRVNSEFIKRAWQNTSQRGGIRNASTKLAEQMMDTREDRTDEMVEYLLLQEKRDIHERAHSRVAPTPRTPAPRPIPRGEPRGGRGGGRGGGGRPTGYSAYAREGAGDGGAVNPEGCYGCGSTEHYKSDCPHRNKKCSECNTVGHLAKRCFKAHPELRPSRAMAAGQPHIRARAPSEQDLEEEDAGGSGSGDKECKLHGKGNHSTDECKEILRLIENRKKAAKKVSYIKEVRPMECEDKEVLGLAAATQLRRSTEQQRRAGNTRRMEDAEREERQRRLPHGYTVPSADMARRMQLNTDLRNRLVSIAQSIQVPVSLTSGQGQPGMPLMEVARKLVRQEVVPDGWEKRAVERALEQKKVTLSLIECYELEKGGSSLVEGAMTAAWGGAPLSTETSESAREPQQPVASTRRDVPRLTMGEPRQEQDAAAAAGEATTPAFLIYRPGWRAEEREKQQGRETLADQEQGSETLGSEEAQRGGKWEAVVDKRRGATATKMKKRAQQLPQQSETRKQLELLSHNVGSVTMEPPAEDSHMPETARIDTRVAHVYINGQRVRGEVLVDGGSSHTRINVAKLELPSGVDLVGGAGGWKDNDMEVILGDGAMSTQQQRSLRDGVIITLKDPVTGVTAHHYARNVHQNGGMSPGILFGGSAIYGLGLRPDAATHSCIFRVPGGPVGRLPLVSQVDWEEGPPTRLARVHYCHGVELGRDEPREAAQPPERSQAARTARAAGEPVELPPLSAVTQLKEYGVAMLSDREEGLSIWEPGGGGYVAVLHAVVANNQKVARYRYSDPDPAAREAAGQRVQGP